MELGMNDAVVFVYTCGVMVTGLWIGSPSPQITPFTAAAGLVVAALWTGYFRWRVVPRLAGDDEDGDDDPERVVAD